MPSYEGRLELTWTNKHLRLLAHEDESYEWLDPSDYRVAEVRLLHDVEAVGEAGRTRAADNLLIRGDALHALTSLAKLPEFAREYVSKVKLAYLDPPFNTGEAFEHYDDALEHSVWLTMMRDRLILIRDLLTPDGSVWVHLDDAEVAYCRILMDEIFGRFNFVSSVIWQKADTVRNDATRLSVSHDSILVFARDIKQWRARRLPRTEEMDKVYRNPDKDSRGPWLAVPLQGPNIRPNLTFAVVSPTTGREHWPPEGGCWRRSREEVASLIVDNRIYFGRDGNGVPQIKKFLSDVGDRVPDAVWSVKDVGGNRQSKGEMRQLFPDIIPFATPKTERLLERVITISTDPGDIVLDCFAGSGTTAAVAHKMGRRWVAVEREQRTIQTFLRPRLEKVLDGEDENGITKDVGWTGGGGFRVLEVAPTMFSADQGLVCLADGMVNGQLAEATAAQLGFEYEADPPFAGRKGRCRLAVVDGVVNAAVVRLLAQVLDAAERVIICGTGIDIDARPILRELRPGSTLRKIPATLLSEYRSARATSYKPAPDRPVCVKEGP